MLGDVIIFHRSIRNENKNIGITSIKITLEEQIVSISVFLIPFHRKLPLSHDLYISLENIIIGYLEHI